MVSAEDQVCVASIGTVGRGALTCEIFELAKQRPSGDGYIDVEMVIPKWRKFWGVHVRFEAVTGELVRQQIRGREKQVLHRVR